MTKLRKIERDRTEADLATVEALLARLTDADVMQRFSLEEKKTELLEQLDALKPVEEPAAAAALFFGGRPVVGGIGIESEFGGQAITLFQDLISKQYAQDGCRLGERGVVPDKAASRMHVTGIVRGSFGFQFEELEDQTGLLDTSLKSAVDNVSTLISAFNESDEERFEIAAANVEQRVMDAAKVFFSLLKQEGATFRVLIGENDRSFDVQSVERAVERATNTSIEESDIAIEGVLSGILPEGHAFEFRTTAGIVRGRVDKKIPASELSELLKQWHERECIGHFSVKKVYKKQQLSRESLTLVAVSPRQN